MASRENAQEVLLSYESSSLIKVRFKNKHGREINSGAAREIASSFRQARGYMESAASGDRSVRPLLVYYAVLGYSRALTLFLKPGLRENGLSQAHGLSVEGWGQELTRESGDVAALKMKLNRHGTLQQLVEATGHRSFLRNNSSAPNYIHNVPPIADDVEIGVGELLARLPEIHPTYIRWRQDRAAVPIWPQGNNADGTLNVRVDPPFGRADWEAVFPGVTCSESGNVLTGILPGNYTLPALSDVTGVWEIGNLVALKPFASSAQLSKIATAFVVSYMLGMLVRYYPSHWMGMLYNQRFDDALPTMMAALAHVEREFPRMVVEYLEREPQP